MTWCGRCLCQFGGRQLFIAEDHVCNLFRNHDYRAVQVPSDYSRNQRPVARTYHVPVVRDPQPPSRPSPSGRCKTVPAVSLANRSRSLSVSCSDPGVISDAVKWPSSPDRTISCTLRMPSRKFRLSRSLPRNGKKISGAEKEAALCRRSAPRLSWHNCEMWIE